MPESQITTGKNTDTVKYKIKEQWERDCLEDAWLFFNQS